MRFSLASGTDSSPSALVRDAVLGVDLGVDLRRHLRVYVRGSVACQRFALGTESRRAASNHYSGDSRILKTLGLVGSGLQPTVSICGGD